jgi:GNAT superfamily N-acetyltransferase
MRLAFGTFLGLPKPTMFMGDADYVRTRWLADPTAAFGVEIDGELVGSNFATNWGSVGFFGPLTIRPDFWNRGVAKRLMEPVVDCFASWNTKLAGLFTFPDSQKHLGLYQKFGFWPRYLTVIMAKPVDPAIQIPKSELLSSVPDTQREAMLHACRQLTDSVHEGLDLTREVRAVAAQQLGETVLLWLGPELAGMAVCHCGPGTEAGGGTCYVKFGAVRPAWTAAGDFESLLNACEAMAASRGLIRVVAGVNTARREAYSHMLERGWKPTTYGVAMHRPDEPGYSRRGVYVVDDWR